MDFKQQITNSVLSAIPNDLKDFGSGYFDTYGTRDENNKTDAYKLGEGLANLPPNTGIGEFDDLARMMPLVASISNKQMAKLIQKALRIGEGIEEGGVLGKRQGAKLPLHFDQKDYLKLIEKHKDELNQALNKGAKYIETVFDYQKSQPYDVGANKTNYSKLYKNLINGKTYENTVGIKELVNDNIEKIVTSIFKGAKRQKNK